MLRTAVMERTKWEIQDLQKDLKLYRTFTKMCILLLSASSLWAKLNSILELSIKLIPPPGKKNLFLVPAACQLLFFGFSASNFLYTFSLSS